MTAIEVRQIVDQEIGERWSETNDHGVDLRRSLVTPRWVACRNTFPHPDRPKPPTLQMWVVLDEKPGSTDGYVILFDEKAGKFGLGDYGRD